MRRESARSAVPSTIGTRSKSRDPPEPVVSARDRRAIPGCTAINCDRGCKDTNPDSRKAVRGERDSGRNTNDERGPSNVAPWTVLNERRNEAAPRNHSHCSAHSHPRTVAFSDMGSLAWWSMTSSQPLGSIWVCVDCPEEKQEPMRYEWAQIHMELRGHTMRRLLEISEER
jgi:hypothetical protein